LGLYDNINIVKSSHEWQWDLHVSSLIFVIGRDHLRRCLHIFTMATVLQENASIPLNFTSGTILVLKPVNFAFALEDMRYATKSELNLYNEQRDILLQISLSPKHVTFNDYSRRSLRDGWGISQVVDSMGQSAYDVPVSIHHYLTDSEFGRYQILLNGITIYHFEQRFPGPATQIGYILNFGHGLPSGYRRASTRGHWDVDVYQIDDLLPEDRLALGPER